MKDNLIQPVVNMSPVRVVNKAYIYLPLTEHFFFFFNSVFLLVPFSVYVGGWGQLESWAVSRGGGGGPGCGA